MDHKSGEEAPKSTDLAGWQRAVAEGRLRHFRPEAMVAAFQDLAPHTDRAVRDALTRQLSDCIVGIARKRVGRNRPNNGEDMIYDVVEEIFAALLQPQIADGKGLRVAFGARVIFRLKDAFADELRSRVIPAPKAKKATRKGKPAAASPEQREQPQYIADAPNDAEQPTEADVDEGSPGKKASDPSLLDGVRDSDEQIDVNRVLESIPSYKKQLAFRLHMDDVPFKSKKGNSIAKAVGVSERTARAWIEEIQEDLKRNKEVQELLKTRAGEKT